MGENQGYDHREQVGAQARGQSVLAWLAKAWPAASHDEWRRRIDEGRVWVDGAPARPDQLLVAGQSLVWKRPPWIEPEAPLSFAIVHCDDDVLIVDKPSGLPTLPGGDFQEHTLLSLVQAQFPGADPLHRLGRFTSGLVVFARSDRARRELSLAMREHRVRKVYRALASGLIAWDERVIEAPIGPVPYAPLGTLHAASPSGKRARSTVRVLERRPSENATLVEVEIETGRPHQIRIHLASEGHALVGDPLYGAGGLPLDGTRAVPGDGGYWLRAVRVELPRVGSDERLCILAP